MSSDRAKYGSIKATAKSLQTKLTGLPNGVEALGALGFVLEGESYVFSADIDDAAVALRGQHVTAALTRVGVLRSALEALGDVNPPAVALDALKIVTVYATNAAADPVGKGKISATNKALASRLLAATGGREVLQACGFELLEAEGVWAFVESDAGGARQLLAVLGKAEAIWQSLAASRGADAGGAMGAAGAGDAVAAADPDDDAAAAPVTEISLRALPDAASLATRAGQLDLQPVLVRAVGCSPSEPVVELHTWMAVTRRWQLVGSMTTPSSTFTWAATDGSGGGEVFLEVDFGDARGTGKAARLTYRVDAKGEAENEYVAANRFISENFEVIDNNHLEPISRKLRTRVAPVLATIANLQKAVEAAF